ncbi:MAG TPA: VOC family protein [Thermomicrobiales bacterium]|nr:VOC family protein [Thermomicrobiales bacterium]
MSKVGVRYIVDDVDAALAFYTELLGFRVEMHPAPQFGMASLGDLQLFFNQPGAGAGGAAMPDGRLPEPGGWNRIRIEVDDLPATVERLRQSGARFRNDIIVGIGGGGQQILVEDPAGNPVELYQAPPQSS